MSFGQIVETFHRIIEDEFYCVEKFASTDDFYGKAIYYQAYFNILRKNRGRNENTPLDILKIHDASAPVHITALPPIDVSPLVRIHSPEYHLHKAVNFKIVYS